MVTRGLQGNEGVWARCQKAAVAVFRRCDRSLTCSVPWGPGLETHDS